MRETESALRLNDLEPLEALQRLVVFTFDITRPTRTTFGW